MAVVGHLDANAVSALQSSQLVKIACALHRLRNNVSTKNATVVNVTQLYITFRRFEYSAHEMKRALHMLHRKTREQIWIFMVDIIDHISVLLDGP